jgi:hypothetical protein
MADTGFYLSGNTVNRGSNIIIYGNGAKVTHSGGGVANSGATGSPGGAGGGSSGGGSSGGGGSGGGGKSGGGAGGGGAAGAAQAAGGASEVKPKSAAGLWRDRDTRVNV